MSDFTNSCPCCSGDTYDKCCRPFHAGVISENALWLMRSRYSAYVLNIPDYIVATTHPGSPQYTENTFSWKRSISRFSRDSAFHKLDVLDFKEKASLATVTFTAYISQDGRDATFTERSYFEKIENRWLYRTGQLAQGYAPNLVSTGPLKLLPLAYYGDPILRKKAETIPEITSAIRQLVEEMIETMIACNGAGIAAPQVRRSLRLFVIRIDSKTTQDNVDESEVKVFINPKLSLPSEETEEAAEGCLSIPTIRSIVERSKEITVEYTGLDGTVVEERFSGWNARVILHEYDHIEGILFIDRLKNDERLKSTPSLQILEKRLQEGRVI